MKSLPLSLAALRASRLLSCLALLAACTVLLGGSEAAAMPTRALPHMLMTPPIALCAGLLALSALLASFFSPLARGVAQFLATLAALLVLQAILLNGAAPLVGRLPVSVQATLMPWLPAAAQVSGAGAVMFIAAALAFFCTPFRGVLGTQLFAAAASIGLLVMATSLIGFTLGSDTLASLGLVGIPAPMASVVAGLLLMAALAQRGDAGWLSVLLGPTAAGSSARGIIAWTVLAPLVLALLALTGVRLGFYDLSFAFALLAATMCCSLTALVLWNAARVERAQERAASARDAMQIAASRLRLARSATGIRMWEWLPATRHWNSIDGSESLDPSANEFLESGLARALRDGRAEFEFPVLGPNLENPGREQRWMFARCWREQRHRDPVVVGITVDVTERKRAALALETSETRLQLAARALPGFVYDWNCASGKIVRTSGIELMLGYHGAEISPVSRWWEDLVHPEDRPNALPALVARMAEGDRGDDSLVCEYRVRHRDGKYVWIWDHCILVRDREGAVTRVVGSVLDITERKEAAARLAASEHRFKAVLLATTGITWTFSADGRARGEQTSWSMFTGQSSEEIAEMGWLRAIHTDDVRATLDAWREALRSGRKLVTTQRVRRHDGVFRTFSVHAVPVTDEHGAIVEWVGSHTDITEQHAAEERARDSVRRLELALDAANVGMWDWDLDSDRMTWTRQTHLITGVEAGKFAEDALQFFELLLPADLDHAAAFRRAVAEPDAIAQSELELRRPDGEHRWIQNRFKAIADAPGPDGERRVHRIVGTLRDVTHHQQLEIERESLLNAERAARCELIAAGQAKDEFLATISHELRTPLNAILGWAALLQRPKVDASTIADGLKVIERNARAQTQLLGDLLDANQLMSGKLSLNFEPLDLNEAVRATLDSMRVTIATRKVRIEPKIPQTPIPVMGDTLRLQQVVSNLLSNAIKFTPAGGVIEVSTGAEGESAWCEVRDSGEGITAEFLPHVFDKFRQADSGSARRFAGLGLGLAITRQLVESHGGTISVHSEGRGKGAQFRVHLPRLKASAAARCETGSITRATDKPLAGLRILAVDDEADSREYLDRLLAEQGADIVSVASAAEALTALQSDTDHFQLLVSDIGMSGTSGYDLIEAVRERLKMDADELPAVALTAFSRHEDCRRALARGFQKHLAKPVQVGRLIGAIRQLTGRQATDKAARPRHH